MLSNLVRTYPLPHPFPTVAPRPHSLSLLIAKARLEAWKRTAQKQLRGELTTSPPPPPTSHQPPVEYAYMRLDARKFTTARYIPLPESVENARLAPRFGNRPSFAGRPMEIWTVQEQARDESKCWRDLRR